LTKPDAGQAFQAGSFLLCVYLAIQLTRGLDGTEFSGGWLTGPLLSIADIGAVFFIIGLALTFFVPRIAALLGLASSLLCVPLCCFFIAPVPFAQVFARGHEFKVYPAPGFHLRLWPVATLLGVALLSCQCIRRFALSQNPRHAHLGI